MSPSSSPTGRRTAASATRRPSRRSSSSSRSSPRSAASAPTRASSPARRSRPASTLDGTALAAHEAAIRQLLRLQPEGDGFHATATLPVAGATVALDLSGTIDVEAERKRLAKDLAAAAEGEGSRPTAKLGNEAFLAKAPDNVVDKIRGRLTKADEDIARIQAQLEGLPQA